LLKDIGCLAIVFAKGRKSSQTERVSFPEQTLGSGTEVSQPPVQKYGTVCGMHSDLLKFAVFKQHRKSYLFNTI